MLMVEVKGMINLLFGNRAQIVKVLETQCKAIRAKRRSVDAQTTGPKTITSVFGGLK